MKTAVARRTLAQTLEEAGLGNIRSSLAAGENPVRITGLMGPARSLAEAVLMDGMASRPFVVAVPDPKRVVEAVSDLSVFLASLGSRREILPFPPLEVDPYRGLSPHFDIMAARARVLASLMEGKPVVVVASAAALVYRTTEPRLFGRGLVTLSPGGSLEPGWMERRLLEAGYLHEDPVVAPGEFARRGGILDVFPPSSREPLRVEFMGDKIDELRTFDPGSQRTTGSVSEVKIHPAREWIFTERHRQELIDTLRQESDEGEEMAAALERERFPSGACFALPRLSDYRASLFDYLDGRDGRCVVLLEEPAELARQVTQEWERVLESCGEASAVSETAGAKPADLLLSPEELSARWSTRSVALEEIELLGKERQALHLSSQLLPSLRGRLKDFLAEIRGQQAQQRQVHIFVSNPGLAERFGEILHEAGIASGLARKGSLPAGSVALHLGALSHGFVLPHLGHAVFTARDVFAEPPQPQRRRARQLGRFLSDFRDLKVGDYVVHADHGIGVFTGLRKLSHEGEGSEFVVLEYQGRDRLYLPVEKLDLLEKYSSSEGARPRIDKLGGTGWERVKRRVRKSMRDMAEELLQLYAARKAVAGHPFGPDTHWQSEFEDLFEYEETPDQEQAIREVKCDMEAPFPMDRLLCGDVGYGKTEVAMRAAFKAVMEGKQAAVLVPTTVLAFQHLSTFQTRLAPFPARVEMLSRFKTPREQKAILKDLASGAIDIVIGTHRLLSKDVTFKDLGLLVVDEEQRFGVAHKERL
ncbi:MAG: DEAD/DEAH box helicase, partial [Acidobacteriota bacterium]